MVDPERTLVHRYEFVDGLRIHWAEMGRSKQRTPLVLLHGLGDSYLTWKRVAPLFAKDRRVLMPDLIGHGLSERPEDGYTLSRHTHIIARWIENQRLGLVDIVGHSLGGGVAQMLLLECRDRIRRMVLAASGGLGREVGFWLRIASLPYVVEHFGQPFMGFGTSLALRRLRKFLTKKEILALIEMNKRAGSARTLSRTVRDVVNLRGQTRNFLQRIHEVKTLPPIAVIWGEYDSMIPPTHGESLTQAVEGVSLEILPGCGHYLHQEDPTGFVRRVRNFLDAPSVPAARLRGSASRPQKNRRKTNRVLLRATAGFSSRPLR
jgi:pimeloyl-ACP methyl ester carboxylesterase